jgi:predicted nucleic acid-binding protein
MVAYADTSFFFSLYAQDANTAHAGRVAATLDAALVITPLQRHELRNAFRLAVFRREITLAECQNLLDSVEADTKAGVLLETPVAWAEVYAGAEALSAAHSKTLGTRGFDVLHVAASIALGTKNFLTFDARQKALAVKAGLKVKP